MANTPSSSRNMILEPSPLSSIHFKHDKKTQESSSALRSTNHLSQKLPVLQPSPSTNQPNDTFTKSNDLFAKESDDPVIRNNFLKRPRNSDQIGQALDFKGQQTVNIKLEEPKTSSISPVKKKGESHDRKFQDSWLD